MSLEISSIIKGNQIMVFAIPHQDYPKQLVKISRALADVSNSICFVSLNKPHQTIVKDLEKEKIDSKGFYFIDVFASKVSSDQSDKNVAYVSSPRALTELNIAINKCTERWRIDRVLFDSLSTLLLYEGSSSVLRFVHSVINNIRVKGKSCVFTILKEDLKGELTKDLGMFADRVLEIE